MFAPWKRKEKYNPKIFQNYRHKGHYRGSKAYALGVYYPNKRRKNEKTRCPNAKTYTPLGQEKKDFLSKEEGTENFSSKHARNFFTTFQKKKGVMKT